MLGVAAEAEFLRLIDIATTSAAHSSRFGPVLREKFIGAKVKRFQVALTPLIPALTPKSDFENVETNLFLIQAVLRVARNDAGHPSKAAPPQREQVYVLLQLFVPFAEQVMKLRKALV